MKFSEARREEAQVLLLELLSCVQLVSRTREAHTVSARLYAKEKEYARMTKAAPKAPTTAPPSTAKVVTGMVAKFWAVQTSGWRIMAVRETGKPKTTTVVGVTPDLAIGDYVEAHGGWVKDPQYGWQFRASYVCVKLPADEGAITAWLAHRLPWIGPARSQELLRRFGVALWTVLDQTPEKLLEVDGITPERLKEVVAAVVETRAARDVETTLISHGMRPQDVGKARGIWGDTAAKHVEEAPYDLYWVLKLPVAAVEAVTAKLKVSGDDLGRIEFLAAVIMERATAEGHCYAITHSVGAQISKDYGGVEGSRAAAVLRTSRRFHFEDDSKRVYLKHLANAETFVAAFATSFGDAPPKAPVAQVDFGPLPTADQRIALALMVSDESLVIVTGYPGTGKTWTIKKAIDHFDAKGISYRLCAPTGKAARRITESTGREAVTVHRLLEWTPAGFQRHGDNPIEADVVICDESSMLDVQLADSLLRACEGRVVLVGDANQLPPVGPGAVLRDLIRSKAVPVAFLRELKRAAADTWVFRNAPLILEDGRCELDHDGDDFMFYELDAGGGGLLATTVVEVVRGLVDKGSKLSDFQVLSPMKDRVGGTYPLNEALQRDLNENVGRGPVIERKLFDRVQHLAIGDRVMQHRNNYELEVMNGEIGEITDIHSGGAAAEILFADGPRTYKGAHLDDIQLAYACTVHKFQGSEADIAIVVAHSAHSHMLTRQLFYTAVTRAKKRVIVIGDEAGVKLALRTQRDEYRRTRLVERIQGKA